MFESNENIYQNFCQVDVKKLSVFNSVIQFFAIWLDKKYLSKPFDNTVGFIKYYDKQFEQYKKHFSNMKFFLTIEGGEALENNLDNLKKFYDMGVILLTLTWNYENDLAGGINSSCGLKKFGSKVVELMDKLNMIIDISHASVKTFWDVYKLSKNSIVASHSNCKTICNNARNLDDDQILAIKEKNGLIGLNLYSAFISNDDANLNNIIKHTDHLLNLIGDENICLGCDFDGADKYPNPIKNVADMKNVYSLFEKLYGKQISNKIFYDNVKRFLTARQFL